MSSPPPSATHLPLTALTTSAAAAAASGAGNARRERTENGSAFETAMAQPFAAGGRNARFATAEKASDDPSAGGGDGPSPQRALNSTPTALSSLFAAPEPALSRHASYVRTPNGTQYTRAGPPSGSAATEATALPEHLYTKGLLGGRHSDVTVRAFGHAYPLHRLLLDRAPFFYSAFSAPWCESQAREVALHPADIDANITQAAFELALKRLYGCHRVEEEDSEAIGLFATGCWLDMADLIEASIRSLLRQMCPANLSKYIRFVTGNYYGKHGDRVLAAAKAMLCREGYEMPLRYYDGIPGDIVRELLGCDGFWVPDEWERWRLAQRVFNRRLRAKAIEVGLVDLDGRLKVPRPKGLGFMAIRFDSVYRQYSGNAKAGGSDAMGQWLGVYTDPDIAPLLVLMDEGIHFVHMSFEQLQSVREQRDVLGLPLLPEKVISSALWMAMELRQRVVNARKSDLELGLSQDAPDMPEDDEEAEPPSAAIVDMPTTPVEMSEKAAGKQVARDDEPEEGADDVDDEEPVASDSWDGNGQPRKFWIPQVDATYILGGDLQSVAPGSPAGEQTPGSRHAARISASLDAADAQWATDFASGAQDRPETPPVAPGPSHALDSTDRAAGAGSPSPQAPPRAVFSHYPPFRFAAEFPAPRYLKENKRVYSHTVWYAGSLWNVYLQKKETPRHTQLGVYLHRERCPPDPAAAAAAIGGGVGMGAGGGPEDPGLTSVMPSSVDERIGHLERELLIRCPRPRARGTTEPGRYYPDDATGGSSAQDLDTLSGLLRSQAATAVPSLGLDRRFSVPGPRGGRTGGPRDDEEDDMSPTIAQAAGPTRRVARVATLPPYVDRRASIRTYFKIYAPSKGGRVLSVYESTPDDSFPFGQSFGWKSKDLILDDGFTVGGGPVDGAGPATGRSKEPRLRFMVVLGKLPTEH